MTECKFGSCAAVCSKLEERKIFEYIFQTLKLDVYLCEHVAYEVKLMSETWFLLPSLDRIIKGMRGYYIIDPFSGNLIYLNKDNTRLVCTAETCKNKEPYVYDGRSIK